MGEGRFHLFYVLSVLEYGYFINKHNFKFIETCFFRVSNYLTSYFTGCPKRHICKNILSAARQL